ncbi:MAG: Rieske 2Fe-2S domain-containing protein [Myxococcales bacterium]|nr:Rieske 2Fe-2S domain-containing protein [Myxococcales bacterium]
MSERIPLPPFPNGWFKVCYAEELKPGGFQNVKISGRDLVAFRGESGKAFVVDAYCAHLGAHLGVGGRIVGDTLRCPFHGWCYAGDTGKCIDIPYAKKIPAKAEVRAYEVLEQSGFILTYIHDHDEASTWKPPVVPEVANPDYYLHSRRRWELTAHLQELYENGFDVAHFNVLHGMQVKGVVYKIDGPCMSLHLDFVRDSAAQSSAEGMATIRSFMYGPGHSLTRVSGLLEGVSVQSLTPIAPELMELTHNYYVHKSTDKALADQFFDFYAKDWELDMPLWNTKKFRPEPVLTEGDGDIARFRKWYKQFYSQDVSVSFHQPSQPTIVR